MKLYPSIHSLVKRFHLKICWKEFSLLFWYFYYFIFMRTSFFPPFSVFLAWVYILFTASPLEFSWKCSVCSTRILWLSNRVLRHKTLEQCWKKRWLTNRDTKSWRNKEREMCVCLCGPSISTCYLKCIFGFQRTCGGTCTCSAQLRLMSYISHA